MNRIIPLGIVFLTIIALLGCSKANDVEETKIETIEQTLPKNNPPALSIMFNGEKVGVEVFDFCWNDCKSEKSLSSLTIDQIKAQDPKTLTVSSGSEVSVLVDEPNPTVLSFDNSFRHDAGLLEKENQEIIENTITIPDEEGTYYYFIRAKWLGSKQQFNSIPQGDSYYGPIAFLVTAN